MDKKETIYFTRGQADATNFDEQLQIVGIEVGTDGARIVDKEELVFDSDVPNVSKILTERALIDEMESSGWGLNRN